MGAAAENHRVVGFRIDVQSSIKFGKAITRHRVLNEAKAADKVTTVIGSGNFHLVAARRGGDEPRYLEASSTRTGMPEFARRCKVERLNVAAGGLVCGRGSTRRVLLPALKFGFFLLSFSLLRLALEAQTVSQISGIVRDQDGKPISQASIEAVGQRSAEKRKLLTEKDGSFLLAELPPDEYLVSASCDSCSDLSKIVEVGAGQARQVEMILDTKSSASVIAVEDHAASLDASSPKIGINVEAAEIAALPVNGRSFAPLALIAPFITDSGGGDFQNLRFAGQSLEQNRYLLDGIDTSSVISAVPGYIPVPGYQFRLRNSLDTIDEFRIDITGYPAEDGGAAGGQIKLVSKAGSNGWHGALFEYFRNDKLQARNYFDDAHKGELRMNQFGANAGGQFIKDKLFAFLSFEELRQRAGLTIIENVPSLQARSRAAPGIQTLLSAIPLGFQNTGDPEVDEGLRRAVARQDESNYSVRLDYLPSTKQRLFFRYSRASADLLSPDNTTSARDIAAHATPDQILASWIYLHSSSLINQLTLGFNRAPVRVGTNSPASVDGTLLFIGTNASSNFVSPGSLVRLTNGLYVDEAKFDGRTYNVRDVLNWSKGRHSIQLGMDARLLRIPFYSHGGLVYIARNLDSVLANLDLDVIVFPDVPKSLAKQEQYAGYIQDQWRLTPQIQLTLGLRYDYYGAMREQNNRAALIDFNNLTSSAAHGGFYPASKTGLQPRVGLTWSPQRSKGDTILRVGAGIYNGPPAVMDALWPIENAAETRVLHATTFPQTNIGGLSSSNSIAGPLGLDQSSFGIPQQNYLFTASFQQAVHHFVGQLGYTGSLSRHLTQESFANLSSGLDPVYGNPLRPNPAYGFIPFLTNGGNSYYNALQLSLNRHLVDNLTVSASYNLAHSIGDAQGSGDEQAPQDPRCLACERGDNSFDVRQSFAANAVFSFPFGHEQRYDKGPWANALLGGWTMAAAWNSRTGLPVNVVIDRADWIYYSSSTGRYYSPFNTVPADAVAITNVPDGIEVQGSPRPSVVAGVNPYLPAGSSRGFLNPAAFSTPLPGAFGNLGRNALRGPGFSQLDLQLSRRFFAGRPYSFQLKGEVFNLFNHTNFSNPSFILPDATAEAQPGSPYTRDTAAGFGLLNSTVGRTVGLGTSRQFQLSIRLQF